jgi:hypothetical protein
MKSKERYVRKPKSFFAASQLGLDGRADGGELGTGWEGCEVAGVAHTNAADACDSYLEFVGKYGFIFKIE